MDEDEAKSRRTLKRLIKSAGLTPRPMAGGFEIPFHGKYRDFDLRVWMHNGWLSMSTYILELPAAGSARTRLFELLMELNEEPALLKYVKRGDVLALEAQYREEHVDQETFGELSAYIRNTAEHQYPRIFHAIEDGENGKPDPMAELEAAFKRPSANGTCE